MTSTVKVDNVQKVSNASNIIKKCGTTITLGASGDSVTLASGATQSGFGRSGSVNWDTGSIKTANFTAVSGNGYFCNTGGGAFNLQLPASPSAGDIVALKDYGGTFGTYSLTIDRNGSLLEGNAGNFAVSTSFTSLSMVYVDGVKGWVSVEEGTGNIGEPPTFIAATGGNTSGTCGSYKFHSFTSPGTFTVTSVGNPSGGPNSVDYLVVAGGGGGGTSHGAGGGAGGYRESSGTNSGSYTVSPLGACVAAIPVSASPGAYPVTVGGGGPASCGSRGGDGTPSTALGITSTAGGGGGGNAPPQPVGYPGNPGGSGGGSKCGPSYPFGAGNTPPVSPPQGNPGGQGHPASSAGGGGGALVAGGTADPGSGGVGGGGATSCITGTPTAYAGGGGGQGGTGHQPGGTGGGGPGSPPSNGSPGTGGGGGGYAGTGGGGIVIIRYKYQA